MFSKSPGSLGELSGFGAAKGDLNLSWSVEKLWIPQRKRVLGHCRQRLNKDKGVQRLSIGERVPGPQWAVKGSRSVGMMPIQKPGHCSTTLKR